MPSHLALPTVGVRSRSASDPAQALPLGPGSLHVSWLQSSAMAPEPSAVDALVRQPTGRGSQNAELGFRSQH